MHRALVQPHVTVDNNKMIWRIKIQLQTKVSAWYLRGGVVLTKENLVKPNWYENSKCVFYHHEGIVKHFFSSVNLLDLHGQ
jgi:hypothetical protein